MQKTDRTSHSSRRWYALAGLLISAIFLWLALRELHPAEFISNLRQVSVGLLLLGAVVYFAAVAVIAWRWRFLLKAVCVIPLPSLTSVVCIGYMGNNVYPLRAGEALRVFLLKRDHEVPVGATATTVLVERIFDGLVMLSFILLGLMLSDIESAEVQAVASFAAPIFVIALIIFLALASQPQLLRRLLAGLVRYLPERAGVVLTELGGDMVDGLAGLRSPADLAGAVVASFVTWAIEAVVYWIVMFAFGLDHSYWVALLVVGTVNLAGLIPASPGQFGVYEYFVALVMTAAGTSSTTDALAYAIVVHIVIWLPVTLVGFVLLVRRGLGWSAISHADRLQTH